MLSGTFKWFFIGMLLLLVEVLIVSAVVKQSWIVQNIQEETFKNERVFGHQTAQNIRKRADDIYTRWFVKTGIQDSLYQMLLPQNNHSGGLDLGPVSDSVFSHVEGSLGTFWAVVYQIIVRLQVWWMWLPAALLLIIPAIIDGVMMRKVKIVAHLTSSSIRLKYATLTIVISLFMMTAALVSPFAVNPLLPLILILCCILMFSVILANVQKDI
ncbi:DUF4400 domain-containing protein [Thiolapillus sp.]|uniref:DUF4400 domain-containing protein n=3 Tax=Thiolapillus sp. TaxID=2017437 RepID=UPI0025EDA03C|nr:DUF4400 domain-containing protein [Thiolapillus sp.]